MWQRITHNRLQKGGTMSKEELTSLGAYLRSKREETGMSQRQVALKANVDNSFIAKLESGKIATRPNIELLQRVCDIIHADFYKAMEYLGVNPTLPEPRVYFRRALGVTADDAEILAQLVEEFQTKKKRGGEI
jgi:transcriptional regulator with XRE-family HTH domain